MILNFFRADSPESSLRLNMLLVVIPISLILFSVAFFIFYRTLVPVEVVNSAAGLKHTYSEIPWAYMGGFVVAILTGLYSIWYGKKINKEAENETPRRFDPAQLNANPQNLPS